MKMATAKQIAARKLFAKRAKAGTLRRKPVRGALYTVSYQNWKGETSFLSLTAASGADARKAFEREAPNLEIVSVKKAIPKRLATKRLPNPATKTIARKGVPAKSYVKRPSQITRKTPTKRLVQRRTKNKAAGRKGYFPNPITGTGVFCPPGAPKPIAVFRTLATAKQYAEALANSTGKPCALRPAPMIYG